MGQKMEFYFFFSFPFLSLKMHFRFFSLLIKILLTFNKSGLVSFYVFLPPALSIYSHKLSWKKIHLQDTLVIWKNQPTS